MKLKIAEHLTRNRLRLFGFTLGLTVVMLFGFVLPAYLGLPRPLWPWVVGGMLVLLAGIIPRFFQPIYKRWMVVGRALGRAFTTLVLGIFFFLILSPIGLVMRLIGRDPMARTFNRDLETYRLPSSPYSKQNMERPF